MSLPDELRSREGEIPVTGFLKAIGQAIAGVAKGWRAPPRHEHDAEETQADQAQAAVTRAIREGVAKMKGERDGKA